MQIISNFLISEVLWPITVGIWYLPVAMVATALAMRLFFRLHILYAIALSISAHIFSCFAYTFCVQILLSLHLLDYERGSEVILGVMGASMAYASIQLLFQALFFYGLTFLIPISVRRMMLAATIGNLIAALVVIKYS